MTALSLKDAESLLYHEAALLDERRFAEWIDMLTDDILYWIPAWRDDGTQTIDPESELSLTFYRGRRNLEDRFWRLTSGLSPASRLPMRTVHLLGNTQFIDSTAHEANLRSVFTVSRFDPRTDVVDQFHGSYLHSLRYEDGRWKIARKVIRLINDVIPTVLDIDSI